MHAIIGWTGAVLYVVSYFLLSIKKLKPDSVVYQMLNVLGGVCLIINSFHQSDYPSIATNAVWAMIGVFAIFYNRRK